ncbi:MAG: lipopolysaccharide biosynthesis protein [Alphaproteobacteria bacterium]
MIEREDQTVHTAGTIGPHMVRGAAWMVGMRWCVRLIGLVSTAILARLLTPTDFGILAMAMVFVGLLEVLLETGIDQTVIRLKNPTRQDYDSAWTMQIMVGATLTVLIFLSAPFVADFFEEPRLELAVQVLSLRAVGLGLVNIGVVNFRRQLDFAKEFRYALYRKLIGFVVTITCAVILRSYWAMIIGMVMLPWLDVLLSNTMQPYRPRLCTARLLHLWRFTRWLVLTNTIDFVRRRFDQFVVARVAGTTPLANYYIAEDIAVAPSLEVLWPIGRALLPTYSKLIGQPLEAARAYLATVGFVAVLALPIGAGLAVVADDLVLVVLGPQWTAAGPLVAWLGFAGALMGFTGVIHPFFTALGYVRMYAWMVVAEVAVFVPTVIWAGSVGGVEAVAIARLCVVAVSLPCFLFMSTRVAPVSVLALAGAVVRPLFASAAMYVGVRWVHAEGIDIAILRLLLDIVAGVVIYAGVLSVLWLLAGRPDGAERLLLSRISTGLRRWSRA